jgi:transcriptional regulator with XRE-family HTH domain
MADRPDAETAFAESLKTLRVASSMTQAQLADEMASRGFRWHAATVYKVENGERQVQLAEAVEIAKIFDTVIESMTERREELAALRAYQRDLTKARQSAISALVGLQNARKILTAEMSKDWVSQSLSENERFEVLVDSLPSDDVLESVEKAYNALKSWAALSDATQHKSIGRGLAKLIPTTPARRGGGDGSST